MKKSHADTQLKVRLPESSMRPKRKISIDSLFDSEPENCIPNSISDCREDQTPQEYSRSQTAETFMDGPHSESGVSLESANLNASFNLSSFTSVGGNRVSMQLTNNQNNKNCPESVPETVKEVSRESEDSINDRGSNVYQQNSPFRLKNSK